MPGPVAVDNNGRLWVAHITSTGFPDPQTWTFNENPSVSIYCYTLPAGAPCGTNTTFSGLDNPTALSVVPNPNPASTADALLIASNGSSGPTLKSQTLPFNTTAATTLPINPAAGIFSPLGVGKDWSGNFYVALSSPKVEIRKFSAGGAEQWARYGLGNEPGAFDPTPPAAPGTVLDFYTLRDHFQFNAGVTTPGGEWSLSGHTADPFASNPADLYNHELVDPRGVFFAGAGAPWVRHVDPNDPASVRYLFVPSTHRVQAGYYEDRVTIYRITPPSETAHLYGYIANYPYDPVNTQGVTPAYIQPPNQHHQVRIWKQGSTEVTLPAPSYHFRANVDSRGHVWLAFANMTQCGAAGSACACAAPAGSCTDGSIWDIPPLWVGTGLPTPVLYPAPNVPFDTTQAIMPAYDSGTDSLYLLAILTDQTLSGACGTGGVWTIGRFDNWTSAGRSSPQPVYLSRPFDPRRSLAEDDALGVPNACGCQFKYSAFDVAGDMLFVSDDPGVVRAYRKSTGSPVTSLFNGPEVDGLRFYTLGAGFRAVQRPNGEYLVSKTDVGDRAGSVVYRWAWTPMELAPLAWYAADPKAVALAGTTVSVWKDGSGNNHDLVQTASGYRPDFQPTGGLGGKPTLSFNGTTAFLRDNGWSLGAPNGDEAEFTVLAVAQPTTVQEGGIASWYASLGGGWVSTRLVPSGANLFGQTRRQGVNQDNYTFTGTTQVDLTGPHVVAYRFKGTKLSVKVDANPTEFDTVTRPPLSTVMNTEFLVGREDTLFAKDYAGKLSELVVVGRQLSDDEVSSYRTYAHSAWGTP